eukprot:CAMPEP_0119329406 /NCGR_PEP_ID=MMETSP1333-20130426/75745_1 /TAXON_ID=418940 /ORGANISM="Scyphosphaera apsteinii, Strain RCC1455" /LENGTH=158 /DNA_ID=CAMNT_0007338513 /DNA_START=19 /DNA_END=495 /DNA_ORIENTATION=+
MSNLVSDKRPSMRDSSQSAAAAGSHLLMRQKVVLEKAPLPLSASAPFPPPPLPQPPLPPPIPPVQPQPPRLPPPPQSSQTDHAAGSGSGSFLDSPEFHAKLERRKQDLERAAEHLLEASQSVAGSATVDGISYLDLLAQRIASRSSNAGNSTSNASTA